MCVFDDSSRYSYCWYNTGWMVLFDEKLCFFDVEYKVNLDTRTCSRTIVCVNMEVEVVVCVAVSVW